MIGHALLGKSARNQRSADLVILEVNQRPTRPEAHSQAARLRRDELQKNRRMESVADWKPAIMDGEATVGAAPNRRTVELETQFTQSPVPALWPAAGALPRKRASVVGQQSSERQFWTGAARRGIRTGRAVRCTVAAARIIQSASNRQDAAPSIRVRNRRAKLTGLGGAIGTCARLPSEHTGASRPSQIR